MMPGSGQTLWLSCIAVWSHQVIVDMPDMLRTTSAGRIGRASDERGGALR